MVGKKRRTRREWKVDSNVCVVDAEEEEARIDSEIVTNQSNVGC